MKSKFQSMQKMRVALHDAMKFITDEHMEQCRRFILSGANDTPEANKKEDDHQRLAILRFDRIIKQIEEALQ